MSDGYDDQPKQQYQHIHIYLKNGGNYEWRSASKGMYSYWW